MSELIAFTNDDHYKVICQIAPNLDSVYVGMLVATKRADIDYHRCESALGRCCRKSKFFDWDGCLERLD